ncbi:DUF6457 domain-containing protein [Micrococcoides hystricis]|uniref:DUF6457 domain-containing protein n=1 Tax=Micrococcoides hystricis TaxID=1572761 RepID=A0ABV6PAH9_9MICC
MSYPRELDAWAAELLRDLEIPETEVNIDKVLNMSAAVAHGVVRPGAPVSSYILGYVVGVAEATGQAPYELAFDSGLRVIERALARWQEEHPEGQD